MNLELGQSRTLTFNALMSLIEAVQSEGQQLDPNGIIEALAVFYVQLFKVTGWDADPVEHLSDIITELWNDAQGYVGE